MVLLQIQKEERGSHHTVILDIHGDVWSSGSNQFGQLGLGHWNYVDFPERIHFPTKIADIKIINNNTIFIDRDGVVWMCGENNDGQLQLGHFENVNRPLRV